MLPAFIIEEIRRREKSVREADRPQPSLELPLPERRPAPPADPDEDRGYVVIDVM